MQLDRVTKRFGSRTVVDGVTLEIRDRERLALLGPSGSGKSTLLLMIAGLLKPDAGAIRADGAIGMVFQDLALWPHMTVEQHLRFVAPREDPQPLMELLELTPLANARPGTLSGGEAQRLAIARALVVRPKIFLLDEPFGSLDRRIRESLLDRIPDLHRALGTTTILVTHDYEEAYRIADRVAVLMAGKLEQVGTPAEVYESPGSPEIAELTGPVSWWQGKALRPERLSARPDETSDDRVDACRPRAGRWIVRVGRALAESDVPIEPGTRVRISIRP